MDFKIFDTNKGKKSLIYDGFIYRIDGVLKCGDISWRCTNKKCKGRLRIDNERNKPRIQLEDGEYISGGNC